MSTAEDTSAVEESSVHEPPTDDPAVLEEDEIVWRDRYAWLLSAGYRLRDRYNPDWKPSWIGTNKEPLTCEDAHPIMFSSVNHAVRVETGEVVVLKHVDHSKFPREIEVMKYLSSEPLASDPRNHSVRPIDILQDPNDDNLSIIVIPVLRYFDDPPFETMGEALDFILQFLTAMHFLHENRVIHGDVSINNVMMDASGLYPGGFHPIRIERRPDFSGYSKAKYSRTEKPPKYYLIDFGLSKRYEEGEAPIPTEKPGTDRSVPEYLDVSKTVNPFFVDVYCVGNMIRQEFLDGDPDLQSVRGYYDFEFLRPLINGMTNDDPEQRPTMEVALAQFTQILEGMSSATLRSQCIKKGDEDFPAIFLRTSVERWFKKVSYIVRRLPPVPNHK
ncbi:hypothetical protein EST38_g7465 [Candolleomyces aberdarensis]|uniref:Protein kinase domain-containing protein n=1 Tax=Candolleomyces aberdarensis TaxID=2316362 RepID=A0A4V1Q3F3_9AGAR|nr:hypothetical protein EST38_g7465 [Candolleomyces aberdarensis]